jgi:hypothetical protein
MLSPIKLIASVLPAPSSVRQSAKILGMVLLGGLLLSPLVGRLPMLGWDWFYFFNRNNPNFNIGSPASAYPPFTQPILGLLTWMDWRQSLSILNAITLCALALGTWTQGGRSGSIVLALLCPPVWFLMWSGHPDGLALLGTMTGLIPLALIKPQITGWSLLRSRPLLLWSAVFLAITLVIWPGWPLHLRSATFTHEAAFGWVVTGWPVLLVGIVLLAGAGDDPYRLMAAGSLISPYLMPYNLALLVPSIGKAKGYKKFLIWASSCLMLLGVGLGGWAKYLNLIFPVAAYCLTHSLRDYRTNFMRLVNTFRRSG